MSQDVIDELRAGIVHATAHLESAVTPEDRARVKLEIAALYRRAEGALGELQAMRDAIRGLVERFKQMAPERAVVAPPPSAPVRADHLGASTFLEKGWSLIASGDHAAAIGALEQALRLAPGDAHAEALLGWALMLDDLHDEALAAFSRVLAREPDNALARVNLGYICLRKRIFGEAIEHLTRVLREGRDRKATLYANYYLGLVYLERGMFRDAEPFFRQALVLGPNLHEASYDLGRAQWFGGDHDGARATWQAAATAGRHNPWGARCADLLARVNAGEEVPRSRPS
jgi:tetratricopeptide (TPR) repeat protein